MRLRNHHGKSTVYAREKTDDGYRYWRLRLTPRQVARLDNGALISCGLTFGPGDTPVANLHRLDKSPCSHEEWNHSGCQSRCTLRGDDKCQW